MPTQESLLTRQLSGLIETSLLPLVQQQAADADVPRVADPVDTQRPPAGDLNDESVDDDSYSDNDTSSVIIKDDSLTPCDSSIALSSPIFATQVDLLQTHEDAKGPGELENSIDSSTEQETNCPSHAGQQSLIGATMLLATFSTTSSNVMYPSCYGTLGSLFGPLVGFLLQSLMCALAYHTLGLAVALKCKTLGELGQKLAGR